MSGRSLRYPYFCLRPHKDMIRSCLCAVFIPFFFSIFSCNSESSSSHALFSANDDAWFHSGEAQWSNEDGELTGYAYGGSGFVMTDLLFENFILELEFFPDSTVNSGVYIRCKNKDLSASDCYELNIWDQHPNQDARTGAIVSRTKPLVHVNTLNKWNNYRVVCKNDSILAWINGSIVVEFADKSLKKGFIALQAAESGTIRFRNVHLKELAKK